MAAGSAKTRVALHRFQAASYIGPDGRALSFTNPTFIAEPP